MTRAQARRLEALGLNCNRPDNPRPYLARMVTPAPCAIDIEHSEVHDGRRAIPTTNSLMRRLLNKERDNAPRQ